MIFSEIEERVRYYGLIIGNVDDPAWAEAHLRLRDHDVVVCQTMGWGDAARSNLSKIYHPYCHDAKYKSVSIKFV